VKDSRAWPQWPPSGPLRDWHGEPLPWLELEWRQSPSSGSSPPRARARGSAARRVRLDHGNSLLTDELASLWRCLWLGSELSITVLCLLPPLTSAVLLKGDVGI
jgi:hypothetical protein